MANFEIGTDFINNQNRKQATEILKILKEREYNLYISMKREMINGKEVVRHIYSKKKKEDGV